MTKTIIAGLFAVLLVGQSCGQAQRVWSQWSDRGPSCTTFLGTESADRDLLVTFTLGFVAGTNRERAGSDQVMFTPSETETRMEAFCSAHPQNPMADAAFVIVDEVKGR